MPELASAASSLAGDGETERDGSGHPFRLWQSTVHDNRYNNHTRFCNLLGLTFKLLT